jgi:tRNA dimethylallyltransferase
MNKKTCIIICGPTAVGKTDIAVSVAHHFCTKIISCDSRQCYHELNIGVARPPEAALNAIPHYFIGSHSIQEEITTVDFEQYALKAADEIFAENDIAVMVGGTGLYMRAFCDGMDDIPAVDPAIRNSIAEQFKQNGLEWLQQQVKKADPAYFKKGEIQNPRRMMRALEVIRSTGQSITYFQQGRKKSRSFNIIKVGLELPREVLYNRINQRVQLMMDAGLEAEARTLFLFRNLNALQTVGYRELFDYFEGHISLERATELIQQNSRHYAKRQLTWFKKDPEIQWLQADENATGNIISLLSSIYRK